MSQAEDDPGSVEKIRRTVTPESYGHRDISMDTIGWMIFLGLVILLVPLLPILLVGWVLTKLFGFVHRNVLGD